MSLRLRLLLQIGIALSLLWAGVALWTQRDMDRNMRKTLDERLIMAAEMVNNMAALNPTMLQSGAISTLPALSVSNSMVCELSSARGAVVARTLGGADSLASPKDGFAQRTIDGQIWRTYTMRNNGAIITTADRLAERGVLLRDIALAATLPFVAALVGGLLVLWFGVRSGLMPLERLRQALAGRSHDDTTPLAAQGMPAELAPFVSTLNEVFERIRHSFARERRFTSDAAHELRTPLTAVKLHLQVLRISSGADAQAALDQADLAVARMQRTMEQLLTLARVEGVGSWAEDKQTLAGEVVQLATADCPQAERARVQVVHGAADAVALAMPQALAVIAVRNLIDNALRYAPAPSQVEVAMQVDEGGVAFQVSDSGPGLQDEELARAPERFWRRAGSKSGGSGLGLSIVQAIVERFGGDMRLAQRHGGGLVAHLSLPRLR